ncbi:hypothetical protein CBM2637_B110320 [Cupriavidus taiwanensis]|nr:hypothetical protein CBM2637_B110320 [Cupriavidus taiwanensis]
MNNTVRNFGKIHPQIFRRCRGQKLGDEYDMYFVRRGLKQSAPKIHSLFAILHRGYALLVGLIEKGTTMKCLNVGTMSPYYNPNPVGIVLNHLPHSFVEKMHKYRPVLTAP